MWWLCREAKKYWDMICTEIEKIYEYKIRNFPELILLGLKFEEIKPKDRVSLWYLTTAARIEYAKCWKQKQLPTVENWLISLINIVEMDRITKRIRL